MEYRYATKNYIPEHMARTVGRGIPISTKQAVEICSLMRKKPLSRAKALLADIIAKKRPLKFTRFNRDMGHKTKIGPGRFPINASKELLKLMEGIEANAQFKGLNTSDLVIEHICAQKSRKTWKYGRLRSRRMKRTNVEIIVKETPKKKTEEEKKAKQKAETKKEDKAPKEKVQEQPKKPEEKSQLKPGENKK